MTVALIVLEDSTEHARGADVSTKTNYVYSSWHLLSQLSELGLVRPIIGRSIGADSASDATKRTLERISQIVALRLLAYLFTTRSWDTFLDTCRRLLRIREEFPFESYRHENFKSRLQQVCQDIYEASPKYEAISEEGPDHNKTFRIVVCVGKKHHKRLAEGHGRTRKEAETDAAFQGLNAVAAAENYAGRSTTSEPIPKWIHEYCRTKGAELLCKLCGKVLPPDECEAILIPFKHDVNSIKSLKSRLAAVGGRVRQSMATRLAFDSVEDMSKATILASRMNDNGRLVPLVLGTPLGRWLEALTQDVLFRDATAAKPVTATLNALVGAVFVRYGFEACQQLETLLFSEVVHESSDKDLPARSRLQAKIQSVVKDRFMELFKINAEFLNAPNEAHNARIKTTLLLDGNVIGSGVSRRKKDAIEAASVEALKSDKLAELLRNLAK